MKTLAALRERLARCRQDDSGFTMLEIVVVMTIMTIVLVIFTTGITQAYSAEERVDATANTEQQLVTAFQRLDREVRYAAGISTPATVSGDPYVEFLSTFTGTSICTELRIHASTGQLQQRTWTQGMTPLVPGAWTQLASGITGSTPFTLTAANSTFNFQRLKIVLTATSGGNNTANSRTSTITFTALNTSLTTSSATTCTEGRAVS